MSIGWEAFVCDFDSVGRKGSTVTWRGACMEASGDTTPSTVVATERAGKLHVLINGHDGGGPYVRCKR